MILPKMPLALIISPLEKDINKRYASTDKMQVTVVILTPTTPTTKNVILTRTQVKKQTKVLNRKKV